VIELFGIRRGTVTSMTQKGNLTHLEIKIPARGLIGLRTRVMSATRGEAVVCNLFSGWEPWAGEIPQRNNGGLVSMLPGKAVAFALDSLQNRGRLFVKPGDEVYEGMIVGENAKDNDLVVNPVKEKHLTNMRASGSDRNIILTPPVLFTLEEAMEYLNDDELLEVTPVTFRFRKKQLVEIDRRRAK